MKRAIGAIVVVAGLVAHVVAAPARPVPSTQPATTQPAAPNTRPATQPARAAAAMPDSYAILMSKSIFARDGVPAMSGGAPPQPPGGPPGAIGGPEATMALRGVFLADGAYTGVLEDPNSHQTRSIIEGETLSGARIKHLSLAGLEFEAGGKVTHIAIGQNLRGDAVAPPATAPSQPTAIAEGGPHPPGGPPGQGPMMVGPDGQAIPASAMIAGTPGQPPQQPGRRGKRGPG